MKRRKIVTLEIFTGSYPEYITKIISLSQKNRSSYVCLANVHMTVEAYKSHEFSKAVNSADLVTPDGVPIVKSLNILYSLNQVRVDGMSLVPELIKKSVEEKLSVYIYGGTKEFINKTDEYLKKNYPKLNIAGLYSPPFRPLTNSEEENIVQKINNSGANIVFVVLGCPKQEKWMASMKGRIDAAMVGVGGAFPVFIGEQKRAPVWMQRFALEWFYRLIQEPKRLFKRYLITNTVFLYLISKEIYKKYI